MNSYKDVDKCAYTGDIDGLKLHKVYGWSDKVYVYAAMGGNIECLKYA